jgi:hypothetical protein
MNHSEAVETMAVEKYLLDEMGPDARDAFEEHLFDCPECAMDVRAGDAFVTEAKVQLPAMVAGSVPQTESVKKAAKKVAKEKRDWFGWMRPIVLAPACAALLLVVAYQNIVTIPQLRIEGETPRLVPVEPLRGAVRGDQHQKLTAVRGQGLAVPIDLLPADMPNGTAYPSYAFVLVGPDGKTDWTATVAVPVSSSAGTDAGQKALLIPAKMLREGTYTVTVAGVDAQGTRTPVERYVFDLALTD